MEIYLARLQVECPRCDKIHEISRYLECFKPIDRESLYVKCLDCRKIEWTERFADNRRRNK